MAAPTSKKYFCILRASPGSSWNRCHEPRPALFGRSRLGDVTALSLFAAQLVAAHARAALLADAADADLGLHEPVPLYQQHLCLPCLWRAARRRHAVGRAVPRPARPVDVVSRGDVGAQSRASLRHPVAAL